MFIIQVSLYYYVFTTISDIIMSLTPSSILLYRGCPKKCYLDNFEGLDHNEYCDCTLEPEDYIESPYEIYWMVVHFEPNFEYYLGLDGYIDWNKVEIQKSRDLDTYMDVYDEWWLRGYYYSDLEYYSPELLAHPFIRQMFCVHLISIAEFNEEELNQYLANIHMRRDVNNFPYNISDSVKYNDLLVRSITNTDISLILKVFNLSKLYSDFVFYDLYRIVKQVISESPKDIKSIKLELTFISSEGVKLVKPYYLEADELIDYIEFHYYNNQTNGFILALGIDDFYDNDDYRSVSAMTLEFKYSLTPHPTRNPFGVVASFGTPLEDLQPEASPQGLGVRFEDLYITPFNEFKSNLTPFFLLLLFTISYYLDVPHFTCSSLILLKVVQSKGDRSLIFALHNTELLEGESLVRGIHAQLWSNQNFLNFGEYKNIIATGMNTTDEFNFHPNVLVTNKTTADEYYDSVKNSLFVDDYSYENGQINLLMIRVWDMTKYTNSHIKITKRSNGTYSFITTPKPFGAVKSRSYSTSANTNKKANNLINPLKPNKTLALISTIDIETVEYNDIQVPVMVGLKCFKKDLSKTFILDKDLVNKDIELAISKLWLEVFNWIKQFSNYYENIFAHNLGGFDGYFIYKGLVNYVGNNISAVETIIDPKNKFILIKYKFGKDSITFKDSLRIFPVSLNDLCKVFNIEGKLCEYNSAFNDIKVLDNPLLLDSLTYYNIRDCDALYNCLVAAQFIYFKLYSVDISTIVSTSSLALKIFRTKFLNTDIPILTTSVDSFVRKAYYGGATDFYLKKVEDVKYYDVNSLYPFAMKNSIPLTPTKVRQVNNLDNFFGFVKVKVTCPNTVDRPLLPVKHGGKTIFPTGEWIGTYFSEELKAAKKHIPEYKYQLLNGYSFNSSPVFDKYIDTLYSVKQNSSGSERWIAKLLLNCLYGVFGRKKDVTKVMNVKTKDLSKFLLQHIVTSITKISDTVSCIMVKNNINVDNLVKLNAVLETNYESEYSVVKNHVAIAAAITAYARIHMMPYKLDPTCAYSDTDSVFTKDSLGLVEQGKTLGLFKDELDGLSIKEAVFLGIKQYGYYYVDNDNNRKEFSVFAGVTRNSLTFDDILKLSSGETIKTPSRIRFYKSFTTLQIKIKEVETNIQVRPSKELVGNTYKPLHLDIDSSGYSPLLSNMKTITNSYNRSIKILNKY